MKIIILFILIFQFSHVNADEIYNLIKIPNLEIYKLKNENNIRYLNAKGDFKIGVDDNITCNKTNQENLNTKFPIIERNIKRYNSKFLKKIDLKYQNIVWTQDHCPTYNHRRAATIAYHIRPCMSSA